VLHTLHWWLDSSTGIGYLAVGMEQRGYRVSIRARSTGDRANLAAG
jgi:hypothetical protein